MPETSNRSQSARLVHADGLKKVIEMPDGRQGVVLSKDGTGMVVMQDAGREVGQIRRDPASKRLSIVLGNEVTPVEEAGAQKQVKRGKASA